MIQFFCSSNKFIFASDICQCNIIIWRLIRLLCYFVVISFKVIELFIQERLWIILLQWKGQSSMRRLIRRVVNQRTIRNVSKYTIQQSPFNHVYSICSENSMSDQFPLKLFWPVLSFKMCFSFHFIFFEKKMISKWKKLFCTKKTS